MSGVPGNLAAKLDPADPARSIKAFADHLGRSVVFTTSFGVEDQAITHIIASQGFDIAIVTLDTGRLFPETYDVWAATEKRYGIRIGAVHPEAGELTALVERQGVNGFYDGLEARKACCHIRKTAPLDRHLFGASGWITGLRADQSAARGDAPLVAWDDQRGLLKLNPLIGWGRDQAVRFTAENDVPVSALHATGFLSIGCAPCTRAIRPGESERAGRWWWEDEEKKECGLHVGPDGRLSRPIPGTPTNREARP
jgi:phosphoadenosine phosphosulfate reductase